jgi:hypothetical protein
MSARALPESFPLLRGHVLPALGQATAEIGAMETVVSKSAEEDPAQRQNSNGLVARTTGASGDLSRK